MKELQNIMYVRANEGRTEQDTGKDTVYLGRVVRRADVKEIEAIIDSLVQDGLDETIILDGERKMVDDGVIEVFDTIDIDTGEIISLIRVPYQKPIDKWEH